MTYHNLLVPQLASTGLGEGLARMISDLPDRFRDWRDARRTEVALSRLSDRELDDIGLARSDIARVCRV